MIEVRHLQHRYPCGRMALQDVTFRVEAGERIALLGSNGAGKSTLFLRLAGVFVGKPGEVLVQHLDPAKPAERRQLANHVGLVFQNPDDQLIAPTVLEDVAFGLLNQGMSKADALAKATATLEEFGLSHLAEVSPQRLSGGEKRRAALAGVAVMQPSILLLDEPTMFLDHPGRKELTERLKNWCGTMVIASHDLNWVIDLCPRTMLLDAGKLVADGRTAELLRDVKLLSDHGLEVPQRLLGG
jgi:cobalt/nickel transport system ATP-binding protein